MGSVKIAQVAEILELNVNTVKTRQTKALGLLRVELKENTYA